jgi:hypothetical protein
VWEARHHGTAVETDGSGVDVPSAQVVDRPQLVTGILKGLRAEVPIDVGPQAPGDYGTAQAYGAFLSDQAAPLCRPRRVNRPVPVAEIDHVARVSEGGLEVIQLMFERTLDFASSASSARDFVDKFSIDYPVLIAGTVTDDDVLKKLPQIAAFKAYPTLFVIDRKGVVRMIHTGFAGPATGAHYDEQNRELSTLVDTLLNESA